MKKLKVSVSCGAFAQGNAQAGYIFAAQRTQKALDGLKTWADTIHDVNPETINWGHVGSLEHIAAMLENVLSAIENQEARNA